MSSQHHCPHRVPVTYLMSAYWSAPCPLQNSDPQLLTSSGETLRGEKYRSRTAHLCFTSASSTTSVPDGINYTHTPCTDKVPILTADHSIIQGLQNQIKTRNVLVQRTPLGGMSPSFPIMYTSTTNLAYLAYINPLFPRVFFFLLLLSSQEFFF